MFQSSALIAQRFKIPAKRRPTRSDVFSPFRVAPRTWSERDCRISMESSPSAVSNSIPDCSSRSRMPAKTRPTRSAVFSLSSVALRTCAASSFNVPSVSYPSEGSNEISDSSMRARMPTKRRPTRSAVFSPFRVAPRTCAASSFNVVSVSDILYHKNALRQFKTL